LLTSIGQAVALAALAPSLQAAFLAPLTILLKPHSLLPGKEETIPFNIPAVELMMEEYFLAFGSFLAQSAIVSITLLAAGFQAKALLSTWATAKASNKTKTKIVFIRKINI